MKTAQTLGLLLLGMSIAALALAQSPAQFYPARPIRLIVPFPPGGSNDIVGRYIGAYLAERFGKQVVVDNRSGGGSIVGTNIAAKAPPDGHTLLVISVAFAMNATLYKLPYDPVNSFARVAMLGTGPNVFLVYPGLPVNSVKEFIALAKAKPGQLHYVSPGIGSFQHFGTELFRILAGIDIVHVPYKGGGAAMVDVMAGQVQVAFNSLIQAMPLVRSGKLKALGTGGAKRSPILPEVPTIAEAGVSGYEANNWWGILAPAGTPAGIIDKLNGEIAAIMALPETQKRFASEGAEPVITTPDGFGKLIVSEKAKWERVTREAGIRAEQ